MWLWKDPKDIKTSFYIFGGIIVFSIARAIPTVAIIAAGLFVNWWMLTLNKPKYAPKRPMWIVALLLASGGWFEMYDHERQEGPPVPTETRQYQAPLPASRPHGR